MMKKECRGKSEGPRNARPVQLIQHISPVCIGSYSTSSVVIRC